MRKIKLFVLTFLLLIITGCDAPTVNHGVNAEQNVNNEDARFVVSDAGSKKYIITDKESHIQYLKIYRNGGIDGGVAIQVLLDGNGTPYVPEQTLEPKKRFYTEELDSKNFLLTDTVTGVQYFIVYKNGGSDGGIDITPLYDKNGLPLVKHE